jgi:hypothetical protein
MSRWIGVLALAAFACAACGGDALQGPASPSSGAGGSSASQGAKIQGNVSAGQPLAAMAAQVVGTSISSPVNAGGGFSLDNVPSGAVQLRFVGSGVDASVALNPVQPGDVVSVLVGVSGATATIQSESRNAGGKVELEGRIEAFPVEEGDQKDNLVVAGRTVEVTSDTGIWKGSAKLDFKDLQIGQRVHVKGTLVTEPTSVILADSITLQNTNEWIPVNVNGIVEVLNTPPPSDGFDFRFQIGSRVIQGDDETKFYGDNDAPMGPEDLKNGQRVEVKGELRDGFVYAFRIHINGLTGTEPPQDDSASVEGILTEEPTGTGSNLTLLLDTKFGPVTVTTTSATVVQRRGSVVTLAALDEGQTIHAVGTRMPDKSLEARFLQIKDDAAEGRFVIEGSLGGLKGTCPARTFGVNGYTVFTTGTTPPGPSDTVYSPSSMTCEDLKNGMKVGVEGYRQADGTVKASTITKK